MQFCAFLLLVCLDTRHQVLGPYVTEIHEGRVQAAPRTVLMAPLKFQCLLCVGLFVSATAVRGDASHLPVEVSVTPLLRS